MIAPRLQKFLLSRLVNLAKDNGIGIGVSELDYESIRILNAKNISVKIKGKNDTLQSYEINSLKVEFKSLFPPKIELNSSLYDGNVDCTVNSQSFLKLLRESTAFFNCSIENFNLQIFPLTGELNILGKVQLILDAKLDSNPNNTVADFVVRIADGYLDVSKFMPSPLLKIPPITQVDFYTTSHFENNLLKINDLGFKSNLGLIKGEAEIKYDINGRKFIDLDTKGTFELTSEGQELISPWIPLINNGKKIESAKGFFKLNGGLNNLKVDISEAGEL